MDKRLLTMAQTYKQAGVDIDGGDELVERIKPLAASTRIAEVVSDIGGFAGMCRIPPGMVEPILVSGTDGVGTKLKIAFATGIHDTVGIDLVAMCINDIITTGARPLFFLDYFATGRLDVNVAESVVRGIADGCRQAGCALLGGETAELPGMYAEGEYDLAGFAVGVVDRARAVDGTRIVAGDALIALPSSGLHSNGYSLARRVIEQVMGLTMASHLDALGESVGDALRRPTRIYARIVQALLEGVDVKGLSHITGGGIVGNLPRVLPDGLGAHVELASYRRPAIFEVIAQGGPVDESEMRRVFNLGVGLIAVVSRNDVDKALALLHAAGELAWLLGGVVAVPPETEFEARVSF